MSSTQLNLIIIDDEPLAHEVLRHHCQQHADINVAGQFYSAPEALAWLANNQTDLILLDINMPVLTGIDMLKVLANKPQIVLCTAHQQYALQGFELDVTDYLLKPVSAERFTQAIEKVQRRQQQAQQPEATTPVINEQPQTAQINTPRDIVIRVDREQRRVALDSIYCLEAYGNYVKVWQQQGFQLTAATLKRFSELLPAHFVQIHKSAIVNQQHVKAVNNEMVTLTNGQQLKTGKAYKHNLEALLTGISLG
ncbi:LytR/AlgR family response regulator transcription factor [Neptunicella marina]|uniref:Response regulator transcription factor n=1 Tax=Neptunicella marina TaxID=2125989 RepID=A0A8J6ITB7_9ALTE|nr:response regulator transcription factor [Neptunicella marina]MBC3767065.1 response regulator transcription factor [Neptunicella marina]